MELWGPPVPERTTLLNCISTIDTVSAGHIYLRGTDVTEIPPGIWRGFAGKTRASPFRILTCWTR